MGTFCRQGTHVRGLLRVLSLLPGVSSLPPTPPPAKWQSSCVAVLQNLLQMWELLFSSSFIFLFKQSIPGVHYCGVSLKEAWRRCSIKALFMYLGVVGLLERLRGPLQWRTFENLLIRRRDYVEICFGAWSLVVCHPCFDRSRRSPVSELGTCARSPWAHGCED